MATLIPGASGREPSVRAGRAARYCHCHRCQRRTGTSSAANARLALSAFEIHQGEERLRYWQPEDGQPRYEGAADA
jgi:hypothetical protein